MRDFMKTFWLGLRNQWVGVLGLLVAGLALYTSVQANNLAVQANNIASVSNDIARSNAEALIQVQLADMADTTGHIVVGGCYRVGDAEPYEIHYSSSEWLNFYNNGGGLVSVMGLSFSEGDTNFKNLTIEVNTEDGTKEVQFPLDIEGRTGKQWRVVASRSESWPTADEALGSIEPVLSSSSPVETKKPVVWEFELSNSNTVAFKYDTSTYEIKQGIEALESNPESEPCR